MNNYRLFFITRFQEILVQLLLSCHMYHLKNSSIQLYIQLHIFKIIIINLVGKKLLRIQNSCIIDTNLQQWQTIIYATFITNTNI